jgi:hypothetical protein
MTTLKPAHQELFRRAEDERFDSVGAPTDHCRTRLESSEERWHPPVVLLPGIDSQRVGLQIGSDGNGRRRHLLR